MSEHYSKVAERPHPKHHWMSATQTPPKIMRHPSPELTDKSAPTCSIASNETQSLMTTSTYATIKNTLLDQKNQLRGPQI
ncbi:hypothetical protein L484_015764 [Morus notabilis]|uniref:Uncharacterized protein n=1 Tax=Morus notabilis TaxID=981085 RepID=W9S4U2_9ROSA|nr:hypothetical protein L484_015764 [Morus notabilis]